MTHRRQYQLSVIAFAATTVYMLDVMGRAISAAMVDRLNTWVVVEIFFSFVLLVSAIIWFVIARSRKDHGDINREDLLLETERYRDRQ